MYTFAIRTSAGVRVFFDESAEAGSGPDIQKNTLETPLSPEDLKRMEMTKAAEEKARAAGDREHEIAQKKANDVLQKWPEASPGDFDAYEILDSNAKERKEKEERLKHAREQVALLHADLEKNDFVVFDQLSAEMRQSIIDVNVQKESKPISPARMEEIEQRSETKVRAFFDMYKQQIRTLLKSQSTPEEKNQQLITWQKEFFHSAQTAESVGGSSGPMIEGMSYGSGIDGLSSPDTGAIILPTDEAIVSSATLLSALQEHATVQNKIDADIAAQEPTSESDSPDLSYLDEYPSNSDGVLSWDSNTPESGDTENDKNTEWSDEDGMSWEDDEREDWERNYAQALESIDSDNAITVVEGLEPGETVSLDIDSPNGTTESATVYLAPDGQYKISFPGSDEYMLCPADELEATLALFAECAKTPIVRRMMSMGDNQFDITRKRILQKYDPTGKYKEDPEMQVKVMLEGLFAIASAGQPSLQEGNITLQKWVFSDPNIPLSRIQSAFWDDANPEKRLFMESLQQQGVFDMSNKKFNTSALLMHI